MSKQQLEARLAAATADLEAAFKARAYFDERAISYRAMAAEPASLATQAARLNASVQFVTQSNGMTREINDLTAEITKLRRDLADNGLVELTPEQVAAMDETAGVFA
jgi:DNA-binding transcriptional MocR family regulator